MKFLAPLGATKIYCQKCLRRGSGSIHKTAFQPELFRYFEVAITRLRAKPTRRKEMHIVQALARKAALLVPNMLTLTAVVCGLTAIRLAQEGKYGWATFAILLAALLDFADGLAARILAAESAFGAELDTLADFLNFGVAPALLLYNQNLLSLGNLGWTIVAIYVLAAGFRLARFNVTLKALSDTAIEKVFYGVPSTAAAVAVILFGALVSAVFEVPLAAPLAAVSTLVASALMISSRQVPTLGALLTRMRKSPLSRD